MRFSGWALPCLVILSGTACGTSTSLPPGPTVETVVPADGAQSVVLVPEITVTFSVAMDPESITAFTGGTACDGTIQLTTASSNFGECIAMEEPPLVSTDARSYSVRPAAPLAPGEEFKIKVDRSARSAEGRRLAAEYVTPDGFTTQIGPAIVSTSPADGATAVAGTSFSITFDRPMNPATVTLNTGTEFCNGTLQLSADDFATCTRMAASPATADDTTFTFAGGAPLSSLATYKLRVTTGVESQQGDPLPLSYETPTGFITNYHHTIAIDGTNDFVEAQERFPTSSAGYFGYAAWDADYLYLGMEGPDVGANDPLRWVLIYFGGNGGTTTGQAYLTQEPTLPFPAKWHLRWKTDNGFTETQEWDGGAWVDAGWDFTGDVFQMGQYVEFRIPRAEVGSPDTLSVHVNMLHELSAPNGGSYAAVPSNSFTDAHDPDYGRYFEFDLNGSAIPTAFAPLP